jgi:hypothetical protein
VRKRISCMLAVAGLVACGGGGSGGPMAPARSPSPTASPSPAASFVPMGVDYGLKRQCIRTVSPDQPNFFADTVDCPGLPYPTSHYWLTVAEIENYGTFGTGCIGPTNQSVLIDGTGSPVTQQWRGSSATGYTVTFKVDYSNSVNPCTAPTWTAVPLIDNVGLGGGPLPRTDQFVVQFNVTYNRTLGSGGATHASVETFANYIPSGSNAPIHVSMTVELWDDPGIWCCTIPPGLPPDVLTYQAGNANQPYVVILDGKLQKPPVHVTLGVPAVITVRWADVFAHAIAERLIPPPNGGWARASATTGDGVIGFEVRNNVAGSGGPEADFTVSDYRESQQLGGANTPRSLGSAPR